MAFLKCYPSVKQTTFRVCLRVCLLCNPVSPQFLLSITRLIESCMYLHAIYKIREFFSYMGFNLVTVVS